MEKGKSFHVTAQIHFLLINTSDILCDEKLVFSSTRILFYNSWSYCMVVFMIRFIFTSRNVSRIKHMYMPFNFQNKQKNSLFQFRGVPLN